MDDQISAALLGELKNISQTLRERQEVNLSPQSIDALANAIVTKFQAKDFTEQKPASPSKEHISTKESTVRSDKTSLQMDRRNVMAGGFAAALGTMLLTKPETAKGAVGEENVALAAILKENAALVAQAAQIYNTVHDFVKKWNSFIEDFNEVMKTAEKTRDFVKQFADLKTNPILEDARYMRDYVDSFLMKNEDIFKFRIKKFNWESRAIVRYVEGFVSGMDSLWLDGAEIAKKMTGKQKPSDKEIMNTPPARVAVRVSHSVMLAGQSEIQATQTKTNAKKLFEQLQNEVKNNKTQSKSAGELFNESSGPMIIDLLSTIAELQAQTVYALNTMLMTSLGQKPPLIGNESRMNKKNLDEIFEGLRQGRKTRDFSSDKRFGDES